MLFLLYDFISDSLLKLLSFNFFRVNRVLTTFKNQQHICFSLFLAVNVEPYIPVNEQYIVLKLSAFVEKYKPTPAVFLDLLTGVNRAESDHRYITKQNES